MRVFKTDSKFTVVYRRDLLASGNTPFTDGLELESLGLALSFAVILLGKLSLQTNDYQEVVDLLMGIEDCEIYFGY